MPGIEIVLDRTLGVNETPAPPQVPSARRYLLGVYGVGRRCVHAGMPQPLPDAMSPERSKQAYDTGLTPFSNSIAPPPGIMSPGNMLRVGLRAPLIGFSYENNADAILGPQRFVADNVVRLRQHAPSSATSREAASRVLRRANESMNHRGSMLKPHFRLKMARPTRPTWALVLLNSLGCEISPQSSMLVCRN